MNTHFRGLYGLTPNNCPQLHEVAEHALRGGVRLLQYRDKHADSAMRETRARQLLTLCHTYQVPLIINDDLELAMKIGADGVHLGADDAPIDQARALFPKGIIGASCYNDFKLATQAVRAGASYIAFGSFHPSPTKPDAAVAPLELLMHARRELSIPICAIGGIDAGNAAPLLDAGADMLAVSNAIFSSTDIVAATNALAHLFASND